MDDLYTRQSRTTDPEERRKLLRAFEKRLYDEEVHFIHALAVVPDRAALLEGARLDDLAEPLPEPAARHGVAGRVGTGAGRVVAAARKASVRLVRFLYTDNGGVTRGKATHVNGLAARLGDGIGLTVAMQAMNMLDQLATVDGLGPVGEIRLVPDPATFTVLPYAPRAAAMTTDMRTLDGAPWAACPRDFLKRQIAACAAAGFSVRAAFEGEFSLATRSADGTFAPLDQSLCFSTTGMATAARVMDEIVAALDQQGIEVEQYYPELGHGQQELSIRHAPALAAADRQVFYRETVRGVAYNHGLYASLAPKPFADQAGNGAHIHWSLWDAAGRRSLMADRRIATASARSATTSSPACSSIFRPSSRSRVPA